MTEKEEILKLKDGESWIWPESDYGAAEIWYKNDFYFLFEIPTFGGEPRFSKAYHPFDIDKLIKEVQSWTK